MRIKDSDIEYVKEKTNIVDVIQEQVALKRAGIDSLKGLCPFHDEKSPSFHVNSARGFYHCFGCGASGDAISFLMNTMHLTFVEAVEKLASMINYTLQYEDGGNQAARTVSRTRLLEANLQAASFYASELMKPENQGVAKILNDRGFDANAISKFGVGYAPAGWDSLKNHLIRMGFTDEELLNAGLLSSGSNKTFDRFRNRLVWPIRDAGGQVLGFGARKISEDDTGPKYLNTPETPVYQKSRVLYGLDMARKTIANSKTVIVVEGYTDVMACHLAGLESAVATCGTAFGRDHISLLRRVMGDDPSARVIFTFDPDEAGRKAALRAFSEQHLFSAQTYVAISSSGLDPADLRMQKGDAELRALFENLKPLFEFALEEALKKYDLNSVEGRALALREASPIISGIQDPAVRKGYTRQLSLQIGASLGEVESALDGQAQPGASSEGSANASRRELGSLGDSPGARLEREAVAAIVQVPTLIGDELIKQAVSVQFEDSDLQVIMNAISATDFDSSKNQWSEAIFEALPDPFHAMLSGLLVMPLPQNEPDLLPAYAQGIVKALLERDLLSLKRQMMLRLQRMNDKDSHEYQITRQQIRMLEQARRELKEK